LFVDKGYSAQLQDLWVSGAFELAVSEKILKEIENTLLKPNVHKRLFLEDGEEASVISLIRRYMQLLSIVPSIATNHEKLKLSVS